MNTVIRRGPVSLSVYDHATGNRLGTIEWSRGDANRYRTGKDARFQWPEGIARAGDVLSPSDLTCLSVRPEQVIWLELLRS